MRSDVAHTPPRLNVGLLVLVAAVCAAIFAFNFSRYGFVKESFLWTIRAVVKIAFVFFSASYIASPLHAWFPSRISEFLMRHRATTGAAFAIAQLSAASCAITIWVSWPEVIHAISQPVERVAGLMVFAWILVMLLTSNAGAMQKLGKKSWRGIHTYGSILIWIAYLLDYGRRTIEWSPYYGVFVAMLLLIFVLRAGLIVRRWFVPTPPASA
jgi:hypothetical protein